MYGIGKESSYLGVGENETPISLYSLRSQRSFIKACDERVRKDNEQEKEWVKKNSFFLSSLSSPPFLLTPTSPHLPCALVCSIFPPGKWIGNVFYLSYSFFPIVKQLRTTTCYCCSPVAWYCAKCHCFVLLSFLDQAPPGHYTQCLLRSLVKALPERCTRELLCD